MSGTMLKAIFYARFHEEKGPTVLHQVPEGSVIPLSNTTQQPLFHFPSISNHIIPRREFCDRPLSLLASHHRIIGFPVCIHNPVLYPRSDFIFNFCLVVDEKAEWGAYASVVNDSNTLNLKLFPTRSPPPPIQIYHVPLSTVRFSSLQTNTWDLTVQRIIPFIDGINSVQKIAVLADTDLTLTRRALAHLLYYGCILMLNTFHFGAIYAATAEIGVFALHPHNRLQELQSFTSILLYVKVYLYATGVSLTHLHSPISMFAASSLSAL
ncbi:unnamed protein product [Aureobasidium pullulans]|nr:unnamed protein product [Aureobasidium pullulans]